MPNGYFASVDPFSFSATFLMGTALFKGGLSIDGSPASGNLWVNLPKATYAKLQGGKTLVVEQTVLNKIQAKPYVDFFKKQSNAAQIPWILGPASLIPVVGTVLTITTSTVDGLQRLSAGPVNSDQLSILIADGGTFSRTLALETNNRITTAVFYSVKVGNEARSYAVCSATYGLNVV